MARARKSPPTLPGAQVAKHEARRITSTHGLGYAGAAALQPDGKILAAGLGSGGFALARYKADGSLDQSFGEGGVVSTSIGYSEVASAVSVQPDGKIVAAGAVVQVADEGTTDFALARYMPNGELDPSFGDGGIVTTSFG